MFRLSHKRTAPGVPRASLGAFLILSTFKPQAPWWHPRSGIHVVCSQVKAQAASSWLCRSTASQHREPQSSPTKRETSCQGQSQNAILCLISLVEHVGAVVVPCFGISAFDKEASSDHCWFLFFSVVQSRNSFLVFSDYETNRHSWWKFQQYRKVWSRKYSAPPPRDSTAHPSLYILRESLPFKCRMSIIISFYLKTLFLQKFSTSSTSLIPPWPGWTWITIVRNIFEREEPKYIHD